MVGTLIGFLGAALGSIGGVGGGGIFVPMLTLIIDFDPKSSTALSKCNYRTFPILTPFSQPFHYIVVHSNLSSFYAYYTH